MAYMNQEKKALIAAELKKVIPSTWRWSLAVHHHSTLILTISAAPVDLFAVANKNQWTNGYIQLNEYHLEHNFDGQLLATFKRIKDAMNHGNLTDYFDVGWYVNIHIGKWNKPFQVINASPESDREQLATLKAKLATMS